MRALARYAVTNAVTRALLSQLLTPEDFHVLAHATTISESWTALLKTAYGAAVPENVKVDPLTIEKHLRDATARRFQRSIRQLGGRAARAGEVLLCRWELDNLELALRLWHGKDPSLEALLSLPQVVHDIPYVAITAARSLEEIAGALRGTPYAGPVSASAEKYRTNGAILFVELSLERDYYARLLAATHALGGSDAREGRRIVGAEIDLLNLSWLARAAEYYASGIANLSEIMLPGPSPLSRELAKPGLTSEALAELGNRYILEPLGRTGKGLPSLERASLLESLVNEMAAAEARRMLAGFPFRITCVFAFYLLLRAELKNLCAVFAGKATGMPGPDIMRRLYGVR